MIVVDSSALVAFLTGIDDVSDAVRLRMEQERVAVPHAVDLECASAIRKLVQRGQLSGDEGHKAMSVLRRTKLRRYGHAHLIERIWELRDNMWPYDAAFVALAESLDADLVTIDTKFSGVPGIGCTVRVIEP